MAQARSRARPGLWGAIFVLLASAGAVCSLLAAVKGVQMTFKLDDAIPWGLCVGLDVFCGVALATGALWVAFVAQVAGMESWQTVRAASVCIGVAAYAIAILGGIASQGLKERTWPVVIGSWSQKSVLSGAVWTVLILVLVLALEFLPRFRQTASTEPIARPARQIQVLVLAGAAVIATMHQVGLTRTIGLAEQRVWPLWSGPGLWIEFFLSSLCAALAVLLFASWRTMLAFGKRLPAVIASGVARLLTIALFLYLAVRLTHLLERGVGSFALHREGAFLLLELGLFFAGMIVVSAGETNPKRLYYGSTMIMAGVVANRLNTSITALERSADRLYRPGWTEIIIAYSLVAAGIFMFAVCVKYLPVFVDATEGD